MQTQIQSNRIIVADRVYERPLFGAVAFPDAAPNGYVAIAGLLARPTAAEADGLVANTPDLEPFRQIRKEDAQNRWKYKDDVIVEVFEEAMASNLRLLQEKIVDMAVAFKTPHFFCHPVEKDMAQKTSVVLSEIAMRRFAGIRNADFQYVPVVIPAFLPASGADNVFDNTIRTAIAMQHLLLNDMCRHALSQNPLALRALGVIAFQGINFPMTTPDDDLAGPSKRPCDSYYSH
jgi:hypothetical protein